MSAIAAFPGLSELLAWPTDHLADEAAYWQAAARRWYEASAQVWQDSLSVDWEGTTAEALRAAAHADRLKVSGLVDQLEEAARVARSGASELCAARSAVRYAVEDAGAAGFEVGDDLSVTDLLTGGTSPFRAIRQAEAETLASEIHRRAWQLVAVDQQVAGRITTALAGIGKVQFGEDPLSGIQLVDSHLHEDSRPGNGSAAPDGPHLIYCYPSARPDHWWCEGFEEGKGPYAFFSPFDTSGVG